MNQRHAAKCGYCGRFTSWARWARYNCFAGYRAAWCNRRDCIDRAQAERDEERRRAGR